jgi:hypothetical protein
MRFWQQQIVLAGVGLAVPTTAWLGPAYAPDLFVAAQPRPRGLDLSSSLLLSGSFCWLIAVHRYLGRKMKKVVVSLAQSQFDKGMRNYGASFWRVYLHVDKNGNNLDA